LQGQAKKKSLNQHQIYYHFLQTMNNFYVYLYLREDGTPYYVGKGKNNRAFQIAKRRMKPPSDKSRIIFHTENLTEDQAFELEKELIAKYGRKDNGTGILRNLTDGGEGTSGIIHNDEYRARVSAGVREAMSKPEVRARVSAAVREAMSKPEVRARMSAATKEAMSKPEVRARLKEAMSKPEVRARMSAAIREAMSKPEVRARVSAATKEAMSKPEVKSKMCASRKKTHKNPQFKAKMSATMKAYYEKNPKPKKKLEQSTSTANLAPFFVST
jgi:hypothetical protein